MSISEAAIVEAEPVNEAAEGRFARLRAADRWVGKLGDYLNPILVKEARQALKSKQFTITFALLLTLVWVWSLMAGIWFNPQDFANASRQTGTVFLGYFILLAFPLVVVVAYGAFRSLAIEIEDGTYDLLSITTLSPRQIISGKMGSALLQMMLYLSAVSPCLAFTYLLPGMDIVSIGTILLYVTMASASLSIFSLLLATITSQRHWQILLQVLLVLFLGWSMFWVCAACIGMISSGGLQRGAAEDGFWVAIGQSILYFASFFAILFMCAKAMITFTSENRSTGIRIALMIPPLLMMGSATFAAVQYETLFLPPFVMIIAIYWGVVGSMITAESPTLSPRMLRQLLQSLLGRACSAWFNPGPAAGYMFVVLNMLAVPVIITALQVLDFNSRFDTTFFSPYMMEESMVFAWITWLYLVIYLGVNRLLMTRLHRVAPVNVFLGFLTGFLLFLLGAIVPILIDLAINRGSLGFYSELHVMNVVYTCIEIFDGSPTSRTISSITVILSILAGLVFLLNARGIWSSVLYDRMATPCRVATDNVQLAPAKVAVEPAKTNPWD